MKSAIALLFAIASSPLFAQVGGSAPDGVSLLQPDTGKQALCVAPAAREEAVQLLQQLPPPKDFGAWGALQALYDLRRISLVEYCARRYELAGYARQTGAQQAVPGSAPDETYFNSTYQWTVAYPAGWRVDGANPGDIRIHAPEQNGLCGIHSAEVRFRTADELAEFMRDFNEKYFRARGVMLLMSEKRRTVLPNEISGVEIITDMSNGGRSRRVYVISGTIGHAIDCETATGTWERLEPLFAHIIASFRVTIRP